MLIHFTIYFCFASDRRATGNGESHIDLVLVAPPLVLGRSRAIAGSHTMSPPHLSIPYLFRVAPVAPSFLSSIDGPVKLWRCCPTSENATTSTPPMIITIKSPSNADLRLHIFSFAYVRKDLEGFHLHCLLTHDSHFSKLCLLHVCKDSEGFHLHRMLN